MNLIEINFQKQIDRIKNEIRNCNAEEFDALIYKYNIFNEIKSTFSEGIVKIDEFQGILENDSKLLEKIYNKFLNVNINFSPRTFDDVMLEEFLNEIKTQYSVFSSDTYKGIFYTVTNDCDENKGGYYIEFYKDLRNEYGNVDFDNRLDYMVIHVDNEEEMKNPRKYVEEYIDKLIKELEEDISEEL